MKYLLVGWIKIYQLIPGPWHDQCRFYPTCSNYAIEAISRFGAFQGSILTMKRICKCNPWGPYGYDPVPQKMKKGEKNEKVNTTL